MDSSLMLVQAQLRRRFIEKLQHQRQLRDEHNDENNASRGNQDAASSTPDEKLVHGLVAEYLASKGLVNTLAVFVPEIGGSRNQVDSATILELATMDSATQTAMDCFDHRIVLENTYLAECATQKLEPQKSLEERMVQYQREYDEICDKRLQEELEQYKSTELALVRAEERKRFDREVDKLRAALLQEYRDKQERLQERQREVELAFVARRTELETSLFETRQTLFKDMERLRVKEAELQVKVESDFRHFASETQRFQLWEESVRTQEANLEGIVAQAMREKERSWQIERQQALQDIQVEQDKLLEREQLLTTETGTLKTLKAQVAALQQEVAALDAALSRLKERAADLELEMDRLKSSLTDACTANARLAADKSFVDDELSRSKKKTSEAKEQIKLHTTEVKHLQQQILEMKLNEANVIVTERKRFMQMMEEERDRFQWKENELLARVRELQSRVAESEALTEKYQSQYEDEKVHVESLRHDVSSLNSLLAQAQTTINAKHGAPRDLLSFRSQRSLGGNDTIDSSSSEHFMSAGSERAFMMKMMEMMANFQGAQHTTVHQCRGEPVNHGRHTPASSSQQEHVHQTLLSPPTSQLHVNDEDQEESNRLQEEQIRIQRQLLEQREYDKKKKVRLEEQEHELAEQHRQFEEKMARMRQERIEEEDRRENERKRRQAEEEAKLQEELERQRAALQEAAELQQKLAQQRMADEKKRIEDEQAYQERRQAEEREFNEQIEAKRLQQQLEDEAIARIKREREEEERSRKERILNKEQERIRLEKDREAGTLNQDEEDQQPVSALQHAQADAEEERSRNETAVPVARDDSVEEMPWHETSTSSGGEVATSGSDSVDITAPDDEATTKAATASAEINMASVGSQEEDQAINEVLVPSSSECGKEHDGADSANSSAAVTPDPPAKTPEEEEKERQQAAEEAKKKEDEDAIDVYRQRVLARKAAEKQRQLEQEAETNRKAKEEEERQRLQLLGDDSESEQELELSGGSFAESSGDRSTSSKQGSFGRESTLMRNAIDFNYSKTSEPRNRFDALRQNENQPQQFTSRVKASRYDVDREPPSELGLSSFSSEEYTIQASSVKAPLFTSTTSSASDRGFPCRGSTFKRPQGRGYENQDDSDEVTCVSRSFGRDRQRELGSLDRPSRNTLQRTDKNDRSDNNAMETSRFNRAEYYSSRPAFDFTQSNTRSKFSGDKADSIREPESSAPSLMNSSTSSRTHNDNESAYKAPKIRISSLISGSENQDDPPSPTNSETSISPSSVRSTCTSVDGDLQEDYSKPFTRSPASDISEKNSLASPCSSVSTTKMSTRKEVTKSHSAHKMKQPNDPPRNDPSSMTSLREDLYAFRKQMREVFIRVEDMVDVHRSFFKSDPSTGSPIFDADLQHEAEHLATQAFEQLADLRKQFTILASDFKRSEKPSNEWTHRYDERERNRLPTGNPPSRIEREQHHVSRRSSESEGISFKGSAMPEHGGSDCDNSDEQPREHSRSIPGDRGSSQVDSDDDGPPATTPDSSRSTASTFLSTQLPSRWGMSSESTTASATAIRAPTPPTASSKVNFYIASYLQLAPTNVSPHFLDFDKRMEEIRSSLNAIASGKQPRYSSSSDGGGAVTTPPKISTVRLKWPSGFTPV
ncbi:unnamed protein product [Phytophthora fragariaefolia]|uniref:Unnamed protein product n=1 Tax=Phytophthora fragariaefolia TaxID=1490495 RepID=A0A9W6TY96_9STRA|nr:unnamed protein product [Phytophthora fragariaefolia]